MPDIELLNTLNINCNTIGVQKYEKDVNCNANKDSTIDAGSEQCCANTSRERSCTKTNSNADCYTNIGNKSYLNNRLCNIFLLIVNNNEIEYFLPGPSSETDTNAGSNSNLNNRPCYAILPMVNNNEIEYFLPGPSRESDRKASIQITKQLQKEFENVHNGIGCLMKCFHCR